MRRALQTTGRPIVIGHRGACGYRPEHTLASYELAVRMGADYIETDLAITADGVLVARHEPELGLTTDVAEHPEFADRRITRAVEGMAVHGWFAEDFTLAELKTLRARERLPRIRRANTLYDDREPIPALAEILRLRARLSIELGRRIGVCVETKHERHFAALGRPVEPVLVDTLTAADLNHAGAPVLLMSFDPQPLRALREQVAVPLVRLLESGDPVTDADLAGIADYADAIGPDKALVIGLDAAGVSTGPTGLVERAHALDLPVLPWTFRNENPFLPADQRRGDDPTAYGYAFAEYAAHLAAGVDGLITDNPDTAVSARETTPAPG
jgi:glycerophosphoryl diester phosphodiesterase